VLPAAASAAAPAGAAAADVSIDSALRPALAIEALGPVTVARDGHPLGAGELSSGKATELLLLLVARPEGVTKEQAGLALWPGASAARVRNAFHVMLHHVRRALGGGADRDGAAPWVVFADGRYRLAREPRPGVALDCDVDAVLAAAEALRRAERTHEAIDAGMLAAHAGALSRRLRGEFGEGAGAGDWALEVQDAVQAAWADGMQLLARQHARAGRHEAGAAVLEALVARDPLREGARRELMVLLTAAGERARALRHYEHLAAVLRREVNAEPARETRALAEQLRQLA
jgi:DNA-binding SARP family transcriptional activator